MASYSINIYIYINSAEEQSKARRQNSRVAFGGRKASKRDIYYIIILTKFAILQNQYCNYSKVCPSALQSTLRKRNEDRGLGKFETIGSAMMILAVCLGTRFASNHSAVQVGIRK